MLTRLFGSQARVKLIKAFVLNPEQKFYIRQLSRDLKMQVNSIRRELENLAAFGLLMVSEEPKEAGKEKKTVKAKTDKKYYCANPDFVLLPELKALIVKSQILSSQEFVERLKQVCSPKVLILTGFFANNTKTQTDLLIVGKVAKDKVISLINELEEEIAREINYTILDPKEYRYRVDVADFFLYNILHGRKIVLIDEFEKEEKKDLKK